MIKPKDILKAIDFWEENYPNRLREVPNELEKHKKIF